MLSRIISNLPIYLAAIRLGCLTLVVAANDDPKWIDEATKAWSDNTNLTGDDLCAVGGRLQLLGKAIEESGRQE